MSITTHNQTAREEQLRHLLQRPIHELAAALAKESRKFLSGQPHNDQIGLALFTLAIAHNNQEAWSCLYRQYKPLVLTWISRHPDAKQLIAADDGDATLLINSAFFKFSQAITPTKLEHFPSLSALLKYLRLCTHSVICDEMRILRSRRTEESVRILSCEPVVDDPADTVLSEIRACQLWQLIIDELTNDDERTLMYQYYILDMRPGEICQHSPHIFPTSDDVYRIKRNVLERLRRSKQLHRAVLAQ